MFLKNSSFSEQTAWITIAFTIFIAWYYGNGITELEGFFSTHADQIVWLWISTLIVSIVFAVIAFTVLTVIRKVSGDDDEDVSLVDERDQEIEDKATAWAYFTLSFCIMALLIHVFCQGVIPGYPFFSDVPPLDFLIHGLMFSGLLVEFVARVSQIYRYRMAA
ncbi:hypothetical protein [Colwellia piezophila]|uniref:hypothetical protein n=1 Tax=Colwellia piezophila TaxID=211668 RepID=UPI0003796DBB|nr:hypothetical protein [Colwellia piezophila]